MTSPDRTELARLDAEIARLRAEADAARASIGAACVEHVEMNGHIDVAEQAHDYLRNESNSDGSGKLHDFAEALRVVIDQVDHQRRRANWYEAAYNAGKTKLIERATAELRVALAEALASWERSTHLREDEWEEFEAMRARIAELQKLVTSPSGGVLRPDLAARYDRMSDAVLALLMRRDAGLSIDEQVEQLRGLVAE